MTDPYVICPFDKSHKIMMSRLQGHLLKCMKSHFMTEPTICPFNNQHIIDASQILEHCIICPNIKDVLIPAAICGNNGDSSNNDVSPTPTSACNSAAKTKNDNTAHSNTEMKKETSHLRPLSRPKNEKFETSIKVPDVRGVKKIEKSKNPSQVVLGKKIISEKHHAVTSDTGSINLISHSCDQLKLLAKAANDYGEIYRKLEALEEKDITVAKEMQVLIQKEKEIAKEKKELIETLKGIAFYMNINNNNHHSNDNNQDREEIVACKDDKVHTKMGNNTGEHNEQNGNTTNSKLEKNSSNVQYFRPSMVSLTSLPPTPGSPTNTNKTRSLGRGIMRAYNTKNSSNNTDQSRNHYDAKGSSYKNTD